ncbi:metalloregulator ArsR/SmtB family transcription factor [Kordiimonas sp. SCSIO 12610]|uniref:helix-turn-helix transcriptional regulator n=1 Tax=Kordiimonas sp. SCSIO 12610 TaxID=2829597 RepID=UPI00210C7651|nr:metalloregulator ArsR/SmtB family transcription factor [Kordiimonas sp. SCSIO 12610]UTW54110.1 transcriptional regulator [Kordiimonas sp. SCSIO 12610]
MNKNLSTREVILTELKRRGRLKSAELAAELNVTPMAIFQHFQQLEDEGAVSCISVASGRGRPTKYWELTEKADTYFPDAHRDLSLDIIESVRESLGEEALDKLILHRSKKQYQSYNDALSNKTTVQSRLAGLAKYRSQEGYMAEVITPSDEPGDDTFILVENHCPICEAAKVCSGLCSQELNIFQKLLEDIAEVERTEHKLSGARRCAYKISPRKI